MIGGTLDDRIIWKPKESATRRKDTLVRFYSLCGIYDGCGACQISLTVGRDGIIDFVVHPLSLIVALHTEGDQQL